MKELNKVMRAEMKAPPLGSHPSEKGAKEGVSTT